MFGRNLGTNCGRLGLDFLGDEDSARKPLVTMTRLGNYS